MRYRIGIAGANMKVTKVVARIWARRGSSKKCGPILMDS